MKGMNGFLFYRKCDYDVKSNRVFSDKIVTNLEKKSLAGWRLTSPTCETDRILLLTDCPDDPVNLCRLIIRILETWGNQVTI